MRWRIFPWRRPKSDKPQGTLDDVMRKSAVAFGTSGSIYIIWGSATGTVFILGSGDDGDGFYDEYMPVYEA